MKKNDSIDITEAFSPAVPACLTEEPTAAGWLLISTGILGTLLALQFIAHQIAEVFI